MKIGKYEVTLIGIGLILLFVFVIGMQQGWFKEKVPDVKITPGGGNVDTDQNGAIAMAKYTRIAQTVRSNLVGINWTSGGFDNVCQALMPLTDNELSLVANEYNRMYRGESEYPSFRQAIEEEELGILWFESDNSICQSALLARFNTVGI